MAKAKAKQKGRFKIRVKELRFVPASQLKRHPKNWRLHSPRQRQTLEGIFGEVGIAGAVLGFLDEENDLVTIDGHLREDILGDDDVPVIVTDLSAKEAEKVLATFDTIGGMADVDYSALDQLAKDLVFDSHDAAAAVDSLLAEFEESSDRAERKQERSALNAQAMPEMELQPMEHYDYLMVVCRNRQDWQRLVSIFGLKKVQDPSRRTRKVGLGRAVDASELFEKLDGKKR